jgi:hypothetical protein
MRGSIQGRKPKMTMEQYREIKRLNQEKKNADKQNREPGGIDEWPAPRVIHGAGHELLDAVPQPEGDAGAGS